MQPGHSTAAGHRYHADGDDAVMLHPAIDAVVAPVRLDLDDLRLMTAAIVAEHDGYLAKLGEQLRSGAGELDQQQVELGAGDIALVSVDARAGEPDLHDREVTLSLLLGGTPVVLSLNRDHADALSQALSLAAAECEHRTPRGA